MSESTNFEMLSTGSEFETAAEELERGSQRRAGALRPRAWRRPPRQRQWRPGRLPRSFGNVPFGVWPAAPGWDATPIALGPAYYRCIQDCLQTTAARPAASRPPVSLPEPVDDTAAPTGADASPHNTDQGFSEEVMMHQLTCQCPQCRRRGAGFEVMEFQAQEGAERSGFRAEAGAYEAEGESQYEGLYESEGEGEYEAEWAAEGESPFSEAQEIALAAELLSVSNEAELEQFLGKLWKSVKKVGSFVGRIAKPFAGVLKAVAKRALPFVGGALGSLIPIPGVGTAVGTALGGALSKALEMELGELELEDREFEMARRFVRIAGTAAQQLGQAAPGGNPEGAIASALSAAAQQHVRHFEPPRRDATPRMHGRWVRQGRTLIVGGA